MWVDVFVVDDCDVRVMNQTLILFAVDAVLFVQVEVMLFQYERPARQDRRVTAWETFVPHPGVVDLSALAAVDHHPAIIESAFDTPTQHIADSDLSLGVDHVRQPLPAQ